MSAIALYRQLVVDRPETHPGFGLACRAGLVAISSVPNVELARHDRAFPALTIVAWASLNARRITSA